jgi:non-ribosomal peptide synthetase component F
MAGTSFAGREQENLENQIGLYINNLPLLTSITPGMCWKEYYAEVKETVVNAIKHQAYPLDEMIDDIGYKPDKSRPGIFNVLVELHTAVITEPVQGPGGFTIKPFDKQFTTTNFDLGFECKLEQDETGILIQYNTDLFEPEEIELLKERLLGLIQRIISDQDITIAQTGFTAGEGRNEKNGAFSFSASEKF